MAVTQSLTLTQTGQNVSANTSQVRLRWTSTQTGASNNPNSRQAQYYVSINGGAETAHTVNYTLPKATTTTIVDTTITVPHRSDGTGTVTVRTHMDTRISAGVVEKTATLTLTPIPRGAGLSFSAITIGQANTLTLTGTSSGFTYKIEYIFKSASGVIASSVSSGSVSWTPPTSLISLLPDSASGTGTFRVTTYNGTSVVGARDFSFIANVASSVRPTFLFSYEDPTGASELAGALVQGVSTLHITVTGEEAYGAAITGGTVAVGGNAYTLTGEGPWEIETDVLTEAGALEISTTVTDARGRASLEPAVTLTVNAYQPPAVTVEAYRCLSDGTPSDEGAYMIVVVDGEVTPIAAGSSVTCAVRYKAVDDDTWSTPLTKSGAHYETAPILCNVAKAFNIEGSVTDVLLTTTAPATIPIAYVLLDYYNSGRGIAFGKVATRDGFDCRMPAYFGRSGAAGLYVDEQPVADFICATGTVDGWTYRKWASGVAECWQRITLQFPAGVITDVGFYRSIASVEVGNIITDIYAGTCVYQNVGFLPQVSRHGTYHSRAEIVLFAAAAITARTMTVPIYLFGEAAEEITSAQEEE